MPAGIYLNESSAGHQDYKTVFSGCLLHTAAGSRGRFGALGGLVGAAHAISGADVRHRLLPAPNGGIPDYLYFGKQEQRAQAKPVCVTTCKYRMLLFRAVQSDYVFLLRR